MKARPSIKKSKDISTDVGRMFRQWLTQKMEINPSYSLRAMAKNLRVSPGFLSQVMNGKKALSLARAVQFSQVLNLKTNETDELLRAVTIASGKDQSSRQALRKILSSHKRNRTPFKLAELEKFKVLSRWYHIAILDLTETKGFRAESAWIAKRLKISSIQAKEALDRLRELGLLVADGRGWKKADSLLAFYSEQSLPAVREHHKQMIGKAQEHLNDASAEAFRQRSITGLTLALDPKHLPEAFARIDRFRQEMLAFFSEGNCTEVFQLNVQLFNLSHSVASEDK